jgi:hypothetical protein
MGNKLTREQIAALLDRPEMVTDGTVELSEEDLAEFERMRRMRMALSALDDLEAPFGQWEKIEVQLPSSDVHSIAGSSRRRWRGAWPLQAAAVLAMFAAGLMVGQNLNSPDGSAPVEQMALDDGPAPGIAIESPSSNPEADYIENVAGLVELRDAGWSDRDPAWQRDPAAVAERIVLLDALMDASREALETVPADPVLNNFLFDVADERATLATQLDQSLRMATLEY